MTKTVLFFSNLCHPRHYKREGPADAKRLWEGSRSDGLKRMILSLLTVTVLFSCNTKEDYVFSNEDFVLEISEQGYARSLKVGGEECLVKGTEVPLCEILQYRPYDNENFLMFPAKPRSFPSDHIRRQGDTLFVTFRDTWDIAVIKVDVEPHYMGFKLLRVDYRIDDMGVKRQTEIDEFSLLQLPVRERKNTGEWLNVTWDERKAVCLMGADPKTRIDAFPEGKALRMYAGLDHEVGFRGEGAVLLACPKDDLLDNIAVVEKDFGMPRGVESRRREEYKWSYYELRDVTLENIGTHIEWAKKGGFRTMVLYYPDFASTCGHFVFRPGWDMETLREICRRITEAGLIPGFHIHYSKVSTDDPYINGGVPDTRLNYVADMVLSRPIGATDTEIYLEGSPEILRLENGRRILHIGDEMISYGGVFSDAPYRLTGCQRGLFNSRAEAHKAGTHARQPDMDDWPRFVRIDQNTSLQGEIAERLGEIYRECGFRFLYFDGAEDVPNPYWYNVTRSQLAVYNEMDPAPIFSEGAQKSHYGWHILSRGNAFDLFRPEKLRAAMKKYTLRCAEQISKDFTSVDFGWMDYLAPDSTTVGMQPDHFSYVFSKALAWDAPVSVMGKLDEIGKSARSEDNFAVMKAWEELKNSGTLSQKDKDMLKDPSREWFLWEGKLYEWKMITPEGSPVRAFSFSMDGKPAICYWSVNDPEGKMKVKIGDRL